MRQNRICRRHPMFNQAAQEFASQIVQKISASNRQDAGELAIFFEKNEANEFSDRWQLTWESVHQVSVRRRANRGGADKAVIFLEN